MCNTSIFSKIIIYIFAGILITCLCNSHSFSQKRAHDHKNVMVGTASWYSNHLDKGPTSNGEVFNQKKYTCASNHYNIGTWLRVTNIAKNRSVIVRVNDRMGKHSKRMIDLTKAAAIKIGLTGQGLAKVKIENLGNGKKPSKIE